MKRTASVTEPGACMLGNECADVGPRLELSFRGKCLQKKGPDANKAKGGLHHVRYVRQEGLLCDRDPVLFLGVCTLRAIAFAVDCPQTCKIQEEGAPSYPHTDTFTDGITLGRQSCRTNTMWRDEWLATEMSRMLAHANAEQ